MPRWSFPVLVLILSIPGACGIRAEPPGARDPYSAGWLGARFAKPEEGRSGILVRELVASGPGEKGGLAPQDLIVQLDGEPVNDLFRFLTRIKDRDPGTVVTVTILRGEETRDLQVVLGAMKIRPALDAAFSRGLAWLMAQQREDGTWNTASPDLVDGYVKASPRNTALALLAAAAAPPEARKPHAERIEKAFDALEKYTSPAGWVGDPSEVVRWQAYTTSFAVQAAVAIGGEKRRPVVDRWVKYLEASQLLEPHGVSEFDWYYGSWNYYDEFRRTNVRGDTSVTAAVLDALGAAGIRPDAPALVRAREFLSRCQNYQPRADLVVPLDDGGFFFNPRSSKAGEVHLPGNKTRFRSYGSTTCDGLRGLLVAGTPKEDPAVRSALAWLSRNYTLRENPGFVQSAPLPYWVGIFFYYYWGLTRALDCLQEETVTGPDGTVHYWAREAADWLCNLQRSDGSWANEVNIMEENDPLVATPMALLSLAAAQRWVK